MEISPTWTGREVENFTYSILHVVLFRCMFAHLAMCHRRVYSLTFDLPSSDLLACLNAWKNFYVDSAWIGDAHLYHACGQAYSATSSRV